MSRVGGAAQCKSIRKVAGKLRLELAQYRELQVFAQFASDMDATTQDKLMYGEKLTELIKQRNNSPMPLAVQVAFLYAATQGMLPKDMTQKSLLLFKEGFPDYFRANYGKLFNALNVSGELSHANETLLRIAIESWLSGKGNGRADLDLDTPMPHCPLTPPVAGEIK